MEFFTKSQLAQMRDPTRSRRYSLAREVFRREHARQRAWGLVERHARKLRRLHGGDDGSPLTAAERRLWSGRPGTPTPPTAPTARTSQDLDSPARPAGNQIRQPTPAVPAPAEHVTQPAPTEQATPAAAEHVTQPAPTEQAASATAERMASAGQKPNLSANRRVTARPRRVVAEQPRLGLVRSPAKTAHHPTGGADHISAAAHAIPSTVFRTILPQRQTPLKRLHRRRQTPIASACDRPGEIDADHSRDTRSPPRPAHQARHTARPTRISRPAHRTPRIPHTPPRIPRRHSRRTALPAPAVARPGGRHGPGRRWARPATAGPTRRCAGSR
ncbi:hypothetical protein ACIA5D_05620 [Actinoplanes sp. NPDC051513]|uniref:hypothetical protein n=1 Tax=Actinoplanes sp. NPDC051513 TaxID=3363908 RepID=UPI0037933140